MADIRFYGLCALAGLVAGFCICAFFSWWFAMSLDAAFRISEAIG